MDTSGCKHLNIVAMAPRDLALDRLTRYLKLDGETSEKVLTCLYSDGRGLQDEHNLVKYLDADGEFGIWMLTVRSVFGC